MKFSVDAANLKAAMDRMLPMLKTRKVATIFPEYMHIVANENGAFLIGDVGNYALEIKLQADVQNFGKAYLHHSEIKRISGVSGLVTVSKENKHVCFQCSKKRVELADHDCDVPEGFYRKSEFDIRLFDIKAGNLCDAFASVMPALAVEDTREMLTGYYLNGRSGKVIACDGYRLHAAKLDFQNDSIDMLDLNHTIRGEVYTHLKAILKPNMDMNVSVYKMEHFLKFVGEDFEYYAGYINGEYINVDSIIPKQHEYDFEINASELAGIAKEYVSQCGKDGVMALSASGNRMYAALAMEGYRTIDAMDSFKPDHMPESGAYFTLFNPTYIKDAMASFEKGEKVAAYGTYRAHIGSNVHPTMFVSDKLECLVLPVRGSCDKADVFNRLMFNFNCA